MRSATVTKVLPAPADAVFDYMSDIERLPEWATEFARRLEREDGGWKVVNNLGELWFEIRADRETGVIDMYAGPERDRLAVFPTRVVELPAGRTAYTFTMFQGPEMSDELFESQHASLERELGNVARRFGG